MEAKPESNDRITLALAWLVAILLVVVPLAVTPDLIDRYRVIKESLSRAEGILGAFGLMIALLFAGTARFREMLRERVLIAVVGAGSLWAVVVTLTSTHREHSLESLVTFLTCVLVFLTAWYAAPRIPLLALDMLGIAVLINVALVTLQEYGIYQPFRVSDGVRYRHLASTALLGNPNIVGSYMALVAIVFAGSATRCRGARRWWHGFAAVCAAAGVFVSQTRTGVIALFAGLLFLAIRGSVKRAAVVAAGALILFGVGAAMRLPVIARLLSLPTAIAERGIDAATSGRLTPVLAALEMARDHPVTGAGPGTFKYHYMPYKIRVTEKHARTGHVMAANFGEVHNDHVQLIAETGLPGYLLFLAAIVAIARLARTTDPGETRVKVARALLIPLAATLLVLCLAQFPLYVPITRHLIVTMAGILAGWSRLP